MNNMINKYSAFTLVELIVVITILSVLSTIWFLSFQWYGVSSRDAVRLSDMRMIEKWFSVKLSKSEPIPMPDNKIDITASGTLVTYQWYAGKETLWKIWVHDWWKDPLDGSFYTYSTNPAKNKYQLLGYFENQWNVSMSNNTYADVSYRYIKVSGDELGIILDNNTNIPSQDSNTNIDIVHTNTQYNGIVTNDDYLFSWTWDTLFTKIYNWNTELLNNDTLIPLDSSLMLYFDMETTVNDGWLIKLLDLSQYARTWICKNDHVNVDCQSSGSGPRLVDNKLFFDWIDDHVYLGDENNFYEIIWNNSFTMVLKMNSWWGRLASIIWQRYGDHTSLFQHANWLVSLSMDDTRVWSVKTIDPVAWEHFVAVTFKYDWEDSQTSIFIDWVQSNNNWSSWDGNWAGWNRKDLFIGWQSRQDGIDYPWYYYWFLDDIRIYNRVLSNNEIMNIYETSK